MSDYGLQDRDEIKPNKTIDDVRKWYERWAEFMGDPKGFLVVSSIVIIFLIVIPFFTHFILFIWSYLFFKHIANRVDVLPFRMPKIYGKVDKNDPKPGSTGKQEYFKASGIVYAGVDRDNHYRQVWLKATDVLTHKLYLSTTGGGKTEGLVSEMINFLGMGGGGIYSDAKAANKLAWQIYALARRMGAEDDYLVINYMSAGREHRLTDSDILTNTTNLLSSGSPDGIIQILASVIDNPEDMGANAAFGHQALALLSTVVYGLFDLKTAGETKLGIKHVREGLSLDSVIEQAYGNNLKYSRRSVDSARFYLNSLSFDLDVFNKTPVEKRGGLEFYRQHGFASMSFTRILSSFIDTYSHLYGSEQGHVSYKDVIFNNRILVILLPAMEKSPAELSNLAKLNFTSIKDAASIGLGNQLEGYRKSVLESLISNNLVPSKLISDEHGYASTPGFGVLVAQVRSLGISGTFAGQGVTSLEKGGESEAKELFDNTRDKRFGPVEDERSIDMLMKSTGEAIVAQAAGYNQGGGVNNDMRKQQSAQLINKSRVDVIDVRQQTEGQTHAVIKGKFMRLQEFFANPPLPLTLSINRFLVYDEFLAKEMAENSRKRKRHDEQLKEKELHNAIFDITSNSDDSDDVINIIQQSTDEVKQTADKSSDEERGDILLDLMNGYNSKEIAEIGEKLESSSDVLNAPDENHKKVIGQVLDEYPSGEHREIKENLLSNQKTLSEREHEHQEADLDGMFEQKMMVDDDMKVKDGEEDIDMEQINQDQQASLESMDLMLHNAIRQISQIPGSHDD